MSESTLTAEAHSFQIFWKWFDGKVLTLAQINSKRPASDPPDFEFDHSGKRLAMEHTRIENLGAAKLPPSHQSFIKNRIWKRLGELFQTSWVDMPPVTLSIQFVSCGDVRRSDEGAVAQGVLDLVRQRLVAGASLPMHFFMTDLQPISSCLGDLQVQGAEGSSHVILHSGLGLVDESGLEPVLKAVKTERLKGT